MLPSLLTTVIYIYIYSTSPMWMFPNPCGASGHIQWPGFAFEKACVGKGPIGNPPLKVEDPSDFLQMKTYWVLLKFHLDGFFHGRKPT